MFFIFILALFLTLSWLLSSALVILTVQFALHTIVINRAVFSFFLSFFLSVLSRLFDCDGEQ